MLQVLYRLLYMQLLVVTRSYKYKDTMRLQYRQLGWFARKNRAVYVPEYQERFACRRKKQVLHTTWEKTIPSRICTCGYHIGDPVLGIAALEYFVRYLR